MFKFLREREDRLYNYTITFTVMPSQKREGRQVKLI